MPQDVGDEAAFTELENQRKLVGAHRKRIARQDKQYSQQT